MKGDVLLVEDNAEIREGLREVLEMEGFAVREAPDGAVALEMLRAGPTPALVLLDLMMPVLDGWEVLAILRGTGPDARPRLPVVVLSGVSEAFHVASRYALDVVIKPAEVGRLVDLVRRYAA